MSKLLHAFKRAFHKFQLNKFLFRNNCIFAHEAQAQAKYSNERSEFISARFENLKSFQSAFHNNL